MTPGVRKSSICLPLHLHFYIYFTLIHSVFADLYDIFCGFVLPRNLSLQAEVHPNKLHQSITIILLWHYTC